MRHRWAIIVAAVVTVISIPVLFKRVGIDFLPKETRANSKSPSPPRRLDLDRTDQTFREIENKLKDMTGVINVMTAIGDTPAIHPRPGRSHPRSIYVRLVDLPDRKTKFSQFDMMPMRENYCSPIPTSAPASKSPPPSRRARSNAESSSLSSARPGKLASTAIRSSKSSALCPD